MKKTKKAKVQGLIRIDRSFSSKSPLASIPTFCLEEKKSKVGALRQTLAAAAAAAACRYHHHQHHHHHSLAGTTWQRQLRRQRAGAGGWLENVTLLAATSTLTPLSSSTSTPALACCRPAHLEVSRAARIQLRWVGN